MHDERIDILVVDDDPTNLEMYSRILGRVPQVAVHEALSGREALDLSETLDFGLVLLDVMMPGMDGFQVARALRDRLGDRTPPVIFITAFGRDERDKIRGFEEGGVDYLFKPYDLKLLAMRVRVFVEMEINKRALRRALEHQQRQADELAALLQGARDILSYTDFPVAARSIFDRCKDITGATAGYMALLSRDGRENEVLFLDPGGRDCTVDPTLHMPVRGLRGEAYRDGKAVLDNDFANSGWMRFMPGGHVPLDNVMFAPLIIDDRVVGVMGLANKPGGFTEYDVRMTTAFGELAAVSLRNSRTLESLRRTTRLMQRGQRIADLGSFEWDVAGDDLYASEELAVILGHRDRGPLDVAEFAAHVHPDDRQALETALRSAGDEALPVDLEFRVLSGDDVRIVHLQAESGVGETGGRLVMGACQDVTARRELEQRAIVTQKLDALGQLAGGLAHEMNTPLQYISSNLHYIESTFTALRSLLDAHAHLAQKARAAGLEQDAAGVEDRAHSLNVQEMLVDVPGAVADSMAGLDKVSSIVKSLVRFARAAPEGDACCDLNRMMEDTAALTRSQWEDVAEMDMDLSPDVPAVVGMPGDISHCLLNLVLNAAQAIRAKRGVQGGKGRIAIRTMVDGDRVLLTVEDDGVGIPAQLRDRIFEPFFTTKGVGEGTGMGLAVARAVIRARGGTLEFVSEPGSGAVFTISLPSGSGQCSAGG